MFRDVQRSIFEKLEAQSALPLSSRYLEIFMMALIVANVIVVVLETVPTLHVMFGEFFFVFDVVSVIIFTVEYILRLWTCVLDGRFSRPVLGRIQYAATPMAIIDLLAVLPFYIPMIIPIDLRFMRVLRLFRIFRVLKLGRYTEAMVTLERVVISKKEEIVATLFILLIVLLFTSSAMFYAEHEAQPEDFESIPQAMWWGIVTLATIGYGDVYPVTPLGKFIGGLVALVGIAVYALPAGILASGFAEEVARKKERGKKCPHCGMNLDDPPNKL
jgi:voltage-gated potassium channel